MYASVKKPTVIEIIRLNRLRWFGHVQRMEGNRVAKRVIYMNLGTTILRGRPRNSWQNEVREDGRIVVEKGGTKGCITERNGRSSYTVPLCIIYQQWDTVLASVSRPEELWAEGWDWGVSKWGLNWSVSGAGYSTSPEHIVKLTKNLTFRRLTSTIVVVLHR